MPTPRRRSAPGARNHPGSRWPISTILLAAALAGLAPSAARASEEEGSPKPSYLSPPELHERIEKSKIVYEIHSMDDLEDVDTSDFAGAFWKRNEGLTWPWVGEDENGEVHPQNYPFSEGCTELLQEGEPFFKEKSYDKAEKIYRKAARKNHCFLALSHVGDCYYFRGQPDKALKWYEKAIKANPLYAGSWYFKGDALRHMGRPEEARQAYIEALVRRPRKEVVAKTVAKVGDEIDAVYFDHPFQPKVFARQEEGKVGIYVDTESKEPWWVVFGICKALWLGEPGYRKERTGSAEVHGWSLQEDKECLAAMLESYVAMRDAGDVEKNQMMERLVRITKKGLIDGYILYEIGSIYTPDVALFVDDDGRDSMRRYVEAYVLPRKPKGPWTPDFP